MLVASMMTSLWATLICANFLVQSSVQIKQGLVYTDPSDIMSCNLVTLCRWGYWGYGDTYGKPENEAAYSATLSTSVNFWDTGQLEMWLSRPACLIFKGCFLLHSVKLHKLYSICFKFLW